MDDRRTCKRRLLASGLLLVAAVLLMLVFRAWGQALFPAYRSFSKAVMGVLAVVCSLVPFSLWDTGACVLVACAGVRMVRRRRAGASPWPPVCALVLVASATGFSFVAGWALNHYAPPLATELGLEVGEYSQDQLQAACGRYLADAARLAPQVPRTDTGDLAEQDFFELARVAGGSYERLGATYEVLRGSTAPVKALLVAGEPLLYSGHTGIFWAATGESCVPLSCPAADKPFIMCHEAAHRLGIASEQEANFCAYLACVSSDDVRFAYAGAYNAFVYCLNALAAQDADAAQQVVDEVRAQGATEAAGVDLVLADRVATRERYRAYRGPFQNVGKAVNNGYLKSFGHTTGVQSYGLVVDYLIAWNEANGPELTRTAP